MSDVLAIGGKNPSGNAQAISTDATGKINTRLGKGIETGGFDAKRIYDPWDTPVLTTKNVVNVQKAAILDSLMIRYSVGGKSSPVGDKSYPIISVYDKNGVAQPLLHLAARDTDLSNLYFDQLIKTGHEYFDISMAKSFGDAEDILKLSRPLICPFGFKIEVKNLSETLVARIQFHGLYRELE